MGGRGGGGYSQFESSSCDTFKLKRHPYMKISDLYARQPMVTHRCLSSDRE